MIQAVFFNLDNDAFTTRWHCDLKFVATSEQELQLLVLDGRNNYVAVCKSEGYKVDMSEKMCID